MFLEDEFLKPLEKAYSLVKQRRERVISDWDHLTLGVSRCLEHFESGRSFVQKVKDTLKKPALSVSNYFNAQKSKRRLEQLKSVNDILIKNHEPIITHDPFQGLEWLDNYAIYAGDGHYHKHAAHDRHPNGNNYPVGHIFMLNLRNQMMNHLDVARPKNKIENEIHALKRVGAKALRMREPKGTKVAIVYDRAGIDFDAWYKWKQGSGIYIVTREKKNMKLQCLGTLDYDRSAPLNAGIISDHQVGHSKGTLIRKVTYHDHERNKIFVFITNIFDVPPGVIAFMYKRRWDVEKVFDTFKNYYFETKAWAKTYVAKCQQALFMCLTHNLTTILEERIEAETGIRDEKIIKKQEKRMEQAKVIIHNKKKPVNSLAVKVCRSIQRSKQFLRYVNNKILINSSWDEFIDGVSSYMQEYLC